MTISLTLNDEQLDALAKRVNDWKDRNGFTTATAEDYVIALVMGEIGNYVTADFNAATQRIAELAASKPYSERITLISQLTTQLTT